jgi:hypothetical protein
LTDGSRQDQEPLTFSTVPGRRVPLPETTTVSDYFSIFIKMTTLKRLLPRQISMLNNILKIIKTLDRFQDLENGSSQYIYLQGQNLQIRLHFHCHYQQIFHE